MSPTYLALENQVGRGGWTWYTGSCGWMYRVWIEEVLGFKRRGDKLRIDPSIPADWPGFSLQYRFGAARYEIRVENPQGVEKGVLSVNLDGKTLRGLEISLLDDGKPHQVVVTMGQKAVQAPQSKPYGLGLYQGGLMFGWKKKPFNPREFADAQILKGLVALNLPARREGEWLLCGAGDLRARCSDVQISGEGRVASLIVELRWGFDGPILRENVADFAGDTQKAIQSAVFQWTMSVFVSACGLGDPDGHPGHLAKVQNQDFPDQNGGVTTWRVVASPALTFSFDAAQERADNQKPPPCWSLLEPLARELALQPQLHTIKVFLMEDDEKQQIEASVNGFPTPRVATLLEGFSWRRPGHAGSLRQFYMMSPLD